MVFPEDAIIDPSEYPRNKLVEIVEQIPDPLTGKHIPCDNPLEYKNRQKTYRLSCSAKTHNLYIVANYGDIVECDIRNDSNCPTDGHYMFNTDVAFGSDGSVVAKYHKMQLFHELYYNVPPKPDFIYFDTSFGRFGLFICFDILFNSPGIELVNKYGVQTMVYPTYWFDEMPFRTAQQTQQSWATTNRVNLLAANIQYPPTGQSTPTDLAV